MDITLDNMESNNRSDWSEPAPYPPWGKINSIRFVYKKDKELVDFCIANKGLPKHGVNKEHSRFYKNWRRREQQYFDAYEKTGDEDIIQAFLRLETWIVNALGKKHIYDLFRTKRAINRREKLVKYVPLEDGTWKEPAPYPPWGTGKTNRFTYDTDKKLVEFCKKTKGLPSEKMGLEHKSFYKMWHKRETQYIKAYTETGDEDIIHAFLRLETWIVNALGKKHIYDLFRTQRPINRRERLVKYTPPINNLNIVEIDEVIIPILCLSLIHI